MEYFKINDNVSVLDDAIDGVVTAIKNKEITIKVRTQLNKITKNS